MIITVISRDDSYKDQKVTQQKASVMSLYVQFADRVEYQVVKQLRRGGREEEGGEKGKGRKGGREKAEERRENLMSYLHKKLTGYGLVPSCLTLRAFATASL